MQAATFASTQAAHNDRCTYSHTVLPVGTNFLPVLKRCLCVYEAQGHAHTLIFVCVHTSTHAAPVPRAHSLWRTRFLIAPSAPCLPPQPWQQQHLGRCPSSAPTLEAPQAENPVPVSPPQRGPVVDCVVLCRLVAVSLLLCLQPRVNGVHCSLPFVHVLNSELPHHPHTVRRLTPQPRRNAASYRYYYM